MRKVLMRAHVSPFDNPDFMEMATGNLIGDNLGNLVFSRAVLRTVMTEDTQVDTIRTATDWWKEEDIERFNREYDCFLIPLANAFRPNFQRELLNLTALIERLTIPCVIVGIGITHGGKNHDFDDNVKLLMHAALDKSASVGIRGDSTALYLERLGFTREKDFTVIGCPSMYMFGGRLPYFEKKDLNADSAISVNCKIALSKRAHRFMGRNIGMLKNYSYVPQVLDELYIMYLGRPYHLREEVDIPPYYPDSFANPIYTGGHGVGFLNADSWIDWMKTQEFAFGTRIHGNIVALLAGIPCYVLGVDERIRELSRYHAIPFTSGRDLKKDQTIFDLYDQADYAEMFQKHPANFRHFLEFLDSNGVRHIYRDQDYVEESPFDQKIKTIAFRGPFDAFPVVPPEEQARRLAQYYAYQEDQIETLKQKNQELIRRENVLKEQNKALKKELEPRSVQRFVHFRKRIKGEGVRQEKDESSR